MIESCHCLCIPYFIDFPCVMSMWVHASYVVVILIHEFVLLVMSFFHDFDVFCWYVCVERERERERDVCHSKRIWGRILPSQIPTSDIRIQDPQRWSWSILFQVFINQKSSVLNTFCSCIKYRKTDGLNSELVSLTV